MTAAFRVPELGEGLFEAELVEWKVGEGDAVEPGQALAEILTDKASADLPSPFEGIVVRRLAEEGETIRVGQELIEYEPTGTNGSAAASDRSDEAGREGTATSEPVAAATAVAKPPVATRRRGSIVAASPAVRRLAREAGIDLEGVSGSGRGGRILMRDLVSAIEARGGSGRSERAAPAPPPIDVGEAGTQVRLRGLRRKIAEHMVAAKQNIPHYSLIEECDVTELVRLHQELAPVADERGVKLTFLAFWVKAVVAALKEVPLANATYDEANETIHLHDRYDVGIATATPRGLLVPVVRQADQMNLFELAAAIRRAVGVARGHDATPDDLRGSTFTVTSIGNLAGLASTPIINSPEVAIMGVGRIVDRPRFDAKGEVRRSQVVYLSFSFDHRIVDGAVGAVLAGAVRRRLEAPATLLIP